MCEFELNQIQCCKVSQIKKCNRFCRLFK
uniref:Uncharacterized protein n=1 Tax=Anguilla anguilla TaxID=7936 RepID=A0A0E9W625_ANGAN